MLHELAPVLIAIPVIAVCLWAGITGVRATLTAPVDTDEAA